MPAPAGSGALTTLFLEALRLDGCRSAMDRATYERQQDGLYRRTRAVVDDVDPVAAAGAADAH